MSEEAPAIISIAALAIDCTDPSGLAHWWSRVLGGAVEVHPQGYTTLHTPEGLALDFLPVSEPKTGKNRLATDTLRPGRLGDPPCRPRPAVRRGAAGAGAVRMAEETDTMLQPTQGGGREGGCNASYKRL